MRVLSKLQEQKHVVFLNKRQHTLYGTVYIDAYCVCEPIVRWYLIINHGIGNVCFSR